MHVTLAQYERLTPEQKALVTSIDATIADADDEANAAAKPDPLTWDYEPANEDQGR